MEDRLQECLDDHQGLEIDTENDGAIMCIGTVGEEGAVTFMFQYFPAGLPEKVKGIMQQKKPVIICDRTGDWSQVMNTMEGWCLFHPAAFMT